MSLKFKIGDVIRLKSGGPAMTIIREATDMAAAIARRPAAPNYWLCAWFKHPTDPNQFVHFQTFHEDVLDLIQ